MYIISRCQWILFRYLWVILECGVITDFLTDVWRGRHKRQVRWLPKRKLHEYKKVTVAITLNSDRAKILNLVIDFAEKYCPDYFAGAVIESIRGTLEAETYFKSRLIPKEIAQTLFAQWEKMMKEHCL